MESRIQLKGTVSQENGKSEVLYEFEITSGSLINTGK
jgi:hypothetical protein